MTQRPALSAVEEDVWAQLFAIAECLPTVIDQRLRQDADLGHYDYAVLLTLYRTDGHTAPMIDLSVITAGSFSRLSHTITRLSKRGFVTRERRGANRYVTLTEAGRRTFLAAASGHVEEIRHQVLDHIPPTQYEDLADLLRPIARRLREQVTGSSVEDIP